MAEQIILNTDLYDNLLTERKGDYTAKPRITGTLYNTDIAARIVAAPHRVPTRHDPQHPRHGRQP